MQRHNRAPVRIKSSQFRYNSGPKVYSTEYIRLRQGNRDNPWRRNEQNVQTTWGSSFERPWANNQKQRIQSKKRHERQASGSEKYGFKPLSEPREGSMQELGEKLDKLTHILAKTIVAMQ